MDTQQMMQALRQIREGDNSPLEELGNSWYFNYWNIWKEELRNRIYHTLAEKDEHEKISRENWTLLVATNLFLVIREFPEERWAEYIAADTEEITNKNDSMLYREVRRALGEQIQRDLFDGDTEYQYLHHEESWPASEYCLPEDAELLTSVSGDQEYTDYKSAFQEDPPTSVEDIVITREILEEIRQLTSEKEWEILNAPYGDGAMLAHKYNTTVNNIRVIKHRTIKRLQAHFCN